MRRRTGPTWGVVYAHHGESMACTGWTMSRRATRVAYVNERERVNGLGGMDMTRLGEAGL